MKPPGKIWDSIPTWLCLPIGFVVGLVATVISFVLAGVIA